MAVENEAESLESTSSIGHALADGIYLDRHFESFRPEYELMLDWANIQKGSQVLDAGAGGGGFVPLICNKVAACGTGASQIFAVKWFDAGS